MTVISADHKRFYIKAHQGDGRLFEDIITCLYNDLCGPGHQVVDAGANRGHHTFQLARLVGPEGRVLAVEPVPALSDLIDSQLRRHRLSQVHLVTAALGDTRGVAEFFFRRDMDGWSSLFEKHRPPNTDPANISRFYAPIIRIDDLIDLVNSCSFMKMDLELNEFRAMVGAEAFLRKHRPVIALENAREHAAQLAGYTRQDFFDFVDSIEYKVLDIFLDPFTPDRWGGDDTMPVYNVAVPAELVDKVTALPIQDYFAHSMKQAGRDMPT